MAITPEDIYGIVYPEKGGKQRRYRPPAPVEEKQDRAIVKPNNEKAFENPFQSGWDALYDATPDPIKPVVGGVAAFDTASKQLQANVNAGVMSIPTDLAGMIDLIRVGVPSLVTAIPDRGDESDYFKRLGEDFTKGIFGDEGQVNVQTHIKEKVGQLLEVKPDATAEQIKKFVDQYQDSQEFFDYMTSQMSPGFKLAQYGNDWANRIAGLGKRPDQMTIVDDIEQVFGQSLIGLPSAALRGLGKVARTTLGNAVVDSIPGKVGAKALELVTPLTLPLSPANVAGNTAVGTGISEAARLATGAPSILNGDVADFVTQIDPPDGHGIDVEAQADDRLIAGGVALGTFFAFPAFRRALTDEAAEKAIDGINAGRTLGEQSDALVPQLPKSTGLVDSNAPAKKAANKFGATDDQIDLIDAWQSGSSTVNRVEAEVNAVNHGILANFGETIPMVDIQRFAREIGPERYTLLNQYLYAKLRNQQLETFARTTGQEMSNTAYSLQAAQARGDTRDINRLTKKLTELQEKLTSIQGDGPNSRPSMEDWSQADVKEFIRQGEADPAVQQVAGMMKKVGQDIIEFKRRNGILTDQDAQDLKLAQEYNIPFRERDYADKEGLARTALIMRDRLTGRRSQEGYYMKQEFHGDEQDLKINRPKDALVALQEGLMEAVREVTANNGRRSVIETLESLPEARGVLMRAHEFDVGGGKKSEWISPKQYYTSGRKELGDKRERFVSYFKDGKMRFVEFGDKSLAKSLQYAPLSTIPILNGTRKAWQTMTTGLGAPWFAVKSALWDVPLAKTTSRQGRSFGLIDTYARRMFNESPIVNAIGDQLFDPTAWASAGLAIPYQMAMRSSRMIGVKIAQDLAHSSGFFNTLAQFPGGKEFLANVGTSMTQAFDRSVFNVYQRHLSTSMGHLMDATKIADDYVVKGKGTALGAGFRSTVNAYKAAVESIQNSSRVAFFVENYSRLEAKHGGKVPKGELDKLVQETRNLTGDMSRVSNSKFIQQLTSVIPYGNPIIQGTRHMLGALVPPSAAKMVNKATGGKANMLENRTNKFWGQFISGMMMPTLGAYAVIDSWEGAQDWWYNKVPEWQRGTVIPFPTYEALEYRWENGEWPEFDPKYMHMLPIAPEFQLVQAPITAGLRSMGVFGPATSHIPQNFFTQMASSFDQLSGFATPPVAQAFAAFNGGKLDLRAGMGGQGFFQPTDPSTFGGANADMLTTNSNMSKQMYDIIGALGAGSAQLLAQTWNVADIAMRDGDDVFTALEKALETGSYEAARRLPNVPGLPGMERNYAFTPESEFVYDTERTLEPLIGSGRQRTIELDSKDRIPKLEAMGMIPPENISEPLLKELQETIYGTLRKKGPFKQADEQYTELRVQLNALEASRAKWPEQAYHEKFNELVEQQQKLKSIQSRVLTGLEQDLKGQYGRVFQQVTGQPFTYKTLVDAVRQNVGG